jgi:hypothetical protein
MGPQFRPILQSQRPAWGWAASSQQTSSSGDEGVGATVGEGSAVLVCGTPVPPTPPSARASTAAPPQAAAIVLPARFAMTPNFNFAALNVQSRIVKTPSRCLVDGWFQRQEERKRIQMPSLRWLARLTIPIMAGAALVTNAAIATADPTSDAYLAQLRNLGFTWPPEHDEGLIGMAYIICDDLAWGWNYDHIAQHIHAILDPRGVTFGQVTSMVGLAHSTYCPNVCWTQC